MREPLDSIDPDAWRRWAAWASPRWRPAPAPRARACHLLYLDGGW